MSLRYLVGPVTPARAREWEAHRQQGRCLAFNAQGSTEVRREAGVAAGASAGASANGAVR